MLLEPPEVPEGLERVNHTHPPLRAPPILPWVSAVGLRPPCTLSWPSCLVLLTSVLCVGQWGRGGGLGRRLHPDVKSLSRKHLAAVRGRPGRVECPLAEAGDLSCGCCSCKHGAQGAGSGGGGGAPGTPEQRWARCPAGGSERWGAAECPAPANPPAQATSPPTPARHLGAPTLCPDGVVSPSPGVHRQPCAPSTHHAA